MPKESEISQPVAAALTALKPNPRNNVQMFKIFQNVQFNVVQHKKYIKEMIKLYEKLDKETFRESFKNALMYLFTFGDTSANVDRVIQFVASFCTALDDEEEFLLFIFNVIFDCQCVSGQSVRYRASQLLAAVLSALGDDAALDDDLCDKLLESQLLRLQDTRGAVRCRAALALQRLQSPPDDAVTRAYRFHMCCDPSSSVRRAVIMSIAKTRHNVPFVLERLCDVDEAVRRAAFLYIAAMQVTQLKLKQRITTLKIGLTERSPRVRRVVEEILIPGWLSTFKGNIVDLLKAIRLDNSQDAKDSEYVAGKLLGSLFKRLQISELLEWLPTDKHLRLIPAEKLNKETAWYWRHLAQYLQSVDDDETLESVLPDLVVLTGYIRAIVESPCPSQSEDPVGFSTRQQVLHSLGCMLQVYDATDPAGRAALHTLITDILTGDYGPLSSDVIRAFVAALELVVPEVNQRMEVVAGVINSIRDAPDTEMLEPTPPPPPVVDDTRTKLERARLRVSLNVAMEAQEEAVREQNYELAAACKAKVAEIQKQLDELQAQAAPPPPPPPAPITTVREKMSDSETLNKCLTILKSALDSPQVKTITPVLQMIFKDLEVEIFQNPDIVENALQIVALYGMLDKEFVKENKAFFFANIIDTSNEPLVSTALKCFVDLLCVHGVRIFEDDDVSANSSKRKTEVPNFGDGDAMSESMTSLSLESSSVVIEILIKIMESECAAYRLIVVEGLCKLLSLGHLESASLLSRLMLMWFNPATVDEDKLRQTIGIFFETFPHCVDSAQDQIQKATIPTLQALANAPSNSPLIEIDHEDVVRFIVSLTKVHSELSDSEGAMAMVLCQHLSRRPTAAEAGLVCRALALLQPPRDARLAGQLAAVLRGVVTNLPDKQSSRNLTRYLGALEATERASLNKISSSDRTTGASDGTMQTEDTMSHIGRITTSLPQPIARSTHVVINETVEEEVEIDETSPTDPAISRIEEEPSKECPPATSPKSPHSSTPRTSSSSGSAASSAADAEKAPDPNPDEASDSSSMSPVKKPKMQKARKNKSPRKKQPSKPKKAENKEQPKEAKNKGSGGVQESEKGGVKRSRSQRSLVDVDRALKTKSEAAKSKESPPKTPSPKQPLAFDDLDVSNVTIRRSTTKGKPSTSTSNEDGNTKGAKKGAKKDKTQAKKTKPTTRQSSGNSRSSAGSPPAFFDDSADETELHTIVYENEFEQSLLNDSSELAESKSASKNITIPETPDGSEESESETEPVQTKGKRNAK